MDIVEEFLSEFNSLPANVRDEWELPTVFSEDNYKSMTLVEQGAMVAMAKTLLSQIRQHKENMAQIQPERPWVNWKKEADKTKLTDLVASGVTSLGAAVPLRKRQQLHFMPNGHSSTFSERQMTHFTWTWWSASKQLFGHLTTKNKNIKKRAISMSSKKQESAFGEHTVHRECSKEEHDAYWAEHLKSINRFLDDVEKKTNEKKK
jgi:predicted RNA-binding protein with PIN domain